MSRTPYTCESFCKLHIKFSWISLPGNGKGVRETKLTRNKHIQITNFLIISFEKFYESSLRANSSFGPPCLYLSKKRINVLQIHYKILNIQCISLANCGGLGGLIMGETKGWKVLVLHGKGRKILNNLEKG